MLQIEGWKVNHKKVEGIWRKEGLKVPRSSPKRKALAQRWFLHKTRPLHKNHVWSYDFVAARTSDGRAVKMLTVIIYEYTRECLCIRVDRSIDAEGVLDELSNLFITRAIPEHIPFR